jgi:hypothetical protein
MFDGVSRALLLVTCYVSSVVFDSAISFAADADNGKILAVRWCSSCHVVEPDQKLAVRRACQN